MDRTRASGRGRKLVLAGPECPPFLAVRATKCASASVRFDCPDDVPARVVVWAIEAKPLVLIHEPAALLCAFHCHENAA